MNDIVTTIATLDTQNLLNIIDAQEAAIGELEQLNTIDAADELILDPEAVRPADNRDDQIVDVLGKNNVIAADVGAKSDDIVHGDMDAAPIAPGGAQALINNDVIAVANFKLVDIAAIATNEQVVPAAPVDGFAEVGAGDGLAGIAADQVDVFRVEIRIAQAAVGKLKGFDGEMLAIVPDVLIFQNDLVARAAYRHDQVEGRARELDIGRTDPFK